MRAMVLRAFGAVEDSPLALADCPDPQAGEGQLLVKVAACGVCRTDLHVVEGELPGAKLPIIPGHQVVGEVVTVPRGERRFACGDRVGVAWLYQTCQVCPFCTSGRENLCRSARFTSYDVDGGFAEYIVVPSEFAYPIKTTVSPDQAAPLLCAGIIGYRALTFGCAEGRKRLGLIGFGASAHIAIQVARHMGREVFVFTRSQEHREHARRLGAVWAGGLDEEAPVALDAIVNFAPAGRTVGLALEKLDRGGMLVLAGIHMSPIGPLDYDKHLYYEKQIRSVTAATRGDAAALLNLADEIPIATDVEVFELSEANVALQKLKHSQLTGSAVLKIGR